MDCIFFVGLPGFEPGMTGPESVVLPLHHSPIWIVVIFDTAKVEPAGIGLLIFN